MTLHWQKLFVTQNIMIIMIIVTGIFGLVIYPEGNHHKQRMTGSNDVVPHSNIQYCVKQRS